MHLSDSSWLKFKAGLGRGSNYFAELMALKVALVLAIEKGTHRIQVFGDLQMVIKWMEGTFSCEKFLLHAIFDKILVLKSAFLSISFEHSYTERNEQVDGLSK